MNQQQSVLPAEPWYESHVQINLVVASLAQVASILIRWFGLPVTDAELDIYAADALQIVTIAAGLYAIVKRGKSAVAPLTLTLNKANAMNAANPPLLDSNPTKPSKEIKQ
jgi:hypothetical protein